MQGGVLGSFPSPKSTAWLIRRWRWNQGARLPTTLPVVRLLRLVSFLSAPRPRGESPHRPSSHLYIGMFSPSKTGGDAGQFSNLGFSGVQKI